MQVGLPLRLELLFGPGLSAKLEDHDQEDRDANRIGCCQPLYSERELGIEEVKRRENLHTEQRFYR